jgi:hypothetical protein
MIENFSYITEDGITLKLNLGIGVDKFEGNEESRVLSYFKGQGKGVRWEFQDTSIEILELGKKIEGNPTPDMHRVVVIYPHDHLVYPEPGNAVIYNANGSIHLQLKVPKLISTLAKQREPFMNYEAPLKFYFDRVRWAKNSKGEVVTTVQVGFDRDWLEERELNPETGEFGECTSSGRR